MGHTDMSNVAQYVLFMKVWGAVPVLVFYDSMNQLKARNEDVTPPIAGAPALDETCLQKNDISS